MSNAFAQRREEDLRKLRDLAARSAGKVVIVSVSGTPVQRLELDLRVRTARSSEYPREVQEVTRLEIQLTERYPFQGPAAAIRSPIFHPNVYRSGRICLGSRWLPTEGLDLFVRRVLRLVTFDPDVTNVNSPANAEAARWYSEARRRFPHAFPTERLESGDGEEAKPKLQWRDVPTDAQVARRVIACSGCGSGLRVVAGVVGTIRCPRCGATFEVQG